MDTHTDRQMGDNMSKDAPRQVSFNGSMWNVLGTGVTREDGKTLHHLSSTTKFRQQRNGRVPAQCAVWLPL